VTGPSNAASFTLNSDGSFSYTPNANFFGSDSFTYKANDGALDSNVVTVSLTINAINDAPQITAPATASTNEDTTLTFSGNIVVSDVDALPADTETLTLSVSHGVLTLASTTGLSPLSGNGSGSITATGTLANLNAALNGMTYLPAQDYNTSDTLSIGMNDNGHNGAGGAQSNSGSVAITINAVNDAPVVTSGATLSYTENDPAKVIDAALTVTDVDSANITGATVTISANFNAAQDILAFTDIGNIHFVSYTGGVLTLSGTDTVANYQAALQTVTYQNTSDTPTSAARTISWVVTDDSAAPSLAATSTVNVTPVDDAPVAAADTYGVVSVNTLTVPAPGVLTNDTDVEGDTLHAVLVSGPAHALSFTLNADGSFSYQHDNANDSSPSDSFTYKANDGTLDSNIVTVTINITYNLRPVGSPDSYSVYKGQTLSGTSVLANDSDPEADPMHAVLISGPSHSSSFTLNSDGTFSYTHDNGSSVTDSFTYAPADAIGNGNTTTVTITIEQFITVTSTTPTSAATNVARNTSVVVNFSRAANVATVTTNTANTTCSGTLQLSSDGFTTCVQMTATPVASNGNTTFTITPLTSLAGNTSYTLKVVSGGSGVKDTNNVALQSNYTTSFTTKPAISVSSTSPVNSAVNVALNTSISVTFNTAANPSSITSITSGTACTSTIQLSRDNFATCVAMTGQPTTGDNLTFSLTPATALDGDNQYKIRVTTAAQDSDGVALASTFTQANGFHTVDSPPAITTSASQSINENSTAVGTIAATDPDPGTTLTWSITGGADSAKFSINSSTGALAFLVAPNFEAPTDADANNIYVVTVQVSDGTLTDSRTFNVTVNNVNEPPSAGTDTYTALANTTLKIGSSPATPGTTVAVTADLSATPTTNTLLANDSDPDAATTLTITGNTTPAHGTVTIDSTTGGFLYTPTAGYTGADSFQYTLSDGSLTATGTVNITVSGPRIWYVKDNGGGTTGTSASPFTTLVAAAAAANSSTDIIYVLTGNTGVTPLTAGVSLTSGVRLWGQGIALSLTVNGNLITPIAAGVQPRIGTTGSGTFGVQVVNGTGNEIRGLNISAGLNAVDLSTTGANSGTYTVSDNTVSGTNSGAGVALAAGGSGTATLTMSNNTITSAGKGISVVRTAGTVVLALSSQTVTSTGNNGIDITGGSTTVTAFSNITIGSTTGGIGVNIANAKFDANSTTAAYEQVSGGALNVGVAGANGGSGTSALVLTNPTGDLSFSTFNLYADSGTGLLISGAAAVNNTTPAGFRLEASGGTGVISATNGPAVDINGGTMNLVLSSTTSSGATTAGVSLVSVADGTIGGSPFSAVVNLGNGSLAGASASAFKVDGGSATVSYAGSIKANGGKLVDIGSSAAVADNITLSGALGGTTNTDSGTGIFIDRKTSGTVTFSGTQTLGASASRMANTAVTLGAASGNTGGTINFSGTLSIFTTGVTAFNTTNGGGTVNFSGTDSIDAATGQGLILTGMALSGTLGTVNSTGGANGVGLTNNTGTLTITTGAISGNSTTGFFINNGSANVSYGGTITSSAGRLVDIGSLNVTGGTIAFSGNLGGGTVATAGLGIRVQNKTSGSVTFSGTVTLGTIPGTPISATGIQLVGNTGGTITFSNTMTICTTGAGAKGFTATGGGTVNITGAGNNITTGASIAFEYNGVSSASPVLLSNVTSTTGGAFAITSSLATPFTVGTVTSTTGTAVSITTATGVFSFTKISSNGAAKGISVNSLSSPGTFTVNGTGGNCNSTDTTCSGGTIAGGTTRGAEFITANNVTLKNMYFNGNGTTAAAGSCANDVQTGTNSGCSAGIHLQSVTTASLQTLYVNGTGSGEMGINGLTDSNVTMNTVEVANFSNANRSAMAFENLTGTNPMTSLNFHNNTGTHNIIVTNNTGTTSLTFTSPIVRASAISGGNADGINVQCYNSGTSCTINATSVTFGGASTNVLAGNSVNWSPNLGASMNATLNGGTSVNTNGIYLNGTGTGTTFTYNVSNLTSVTTHNLGSNAITVGNTNGNGTYNGTVANNVITSATCSGACGGIVLNAFGTTSNTFTVTGNNISGVDSVGIQAVGQGTNNNFTIQGNTLNGTVAGNTSYAIDLSSGTSGCLYGNIGDMSATHTVTANKNTISGTWQSGGNPISVVIFSGVSAGKLQGYSGGSDASAAAWVKASNGNAGTDAFHTGAVGFTGGTGCP
jgi:VCBS repeat-containing protein